MPFPPTIKKLKWYKTKAKDGCQLCGWKLPKLKNNGLEGAHIISEKAYGKEKGKHSKDNALLLCNNCHTAFDNIIKPAIKKAVSMSPFSKLPVNW